MNLAVRDVRRNLLRFVLTCLGIGLLLGVVITMVGIYRGSLDDALRLVRAANPDIWIVQAGTRGPFAEASRIPGDTRELVARVYGVARAGSVTYQTVETEYGGDPMRMFLVGYEPGRPGGPPAIDEGRGLARGRYEIVVDRSSGLRLGDQLPFGARGHLFRVVGLTRNQLTAAGDPVGYVSLRDAQQVQFERAPPNERREWARQSSPGVAKADPQASTLGGDPPANSDYINAVVADVSAHVSLTEAAAAIGRWKHVSVLTRADQERLVTVFVIEKQRRQLAMFMGLLIAVSAVVIALIIYMLTLDKLRAIATLKLIGAPDSTVIGLIIQQALAMGVLGFGIGLVLILAFKDRFPRRVVLVPEDIAVLFGVILVVCILASGLGVRAALKVEPSAALAG